MAVAVFDKARYFNRVLTWAMTLVAVSTFNYGFDNQAFSTGQAMNALLKEFGEHNDVKKTWALPTYWLSLFNSLNYVGFAAGVVIGSHVSSRFGRRWCMFSMSLYALILATIVVKSNSR
jgi:MFS transporter, SP family, sugar:H+ symporter